MKNNSLKKSLEYVLHNGIATIAMTTLSSGEIVIAYALLLGASSVDVGLMGNIGYISIFSHIFSAYLINKGLTVKKVSVLFSFISRFFYLIMASLIFFNKSYAILILLVCMVLNSLIGGVSGGAFYPWMKALIPQKKLGTFFAKRYKYMKIASIICYIVSAGIVFIFEKYFPNNVIYAYSILFIIAFVLGIYSVYTLYNVEDVKIENSNNDNFIKKSIYILKNKSFTSLCYFLGLFYFSRSFILPFFTMFMLKKMEFSMAIVIGLTIIYNLSYVLSTKFLAKYINKKGCGNTLRIGSKFFILTICLFTISMYVDVIIGGIFIILAHVILGISQLSLELSLNNMPLLYVQEKDSPIYLSAISVFTAICSTVSGVLAGLFITKLELFNISTTNVWLIFYIIGCVLFASSIIISKIIERKINA